MEDQLSALSKEIQFFSSFDFPEGVRAVANEAVKSIARKENPIPITANESPVIRAINTVLTNPKLAKSSETFLSGLMQTLTGNIYGPEPLELILKGITAVAQDLDSDSVLKFLGQSSVGIMTKFPHLELIRAYMSIVLSLMSHNNVIISSSAFATFPQIFQTLVDGLKSLESFTDEYF